MLCGISPDWEMVNWVGKRVERPLTNPIFSYTDLMDKPEAMVTHKSLRPRRMISSFIFTLLAIEFLDEFVFGAREAAWPLIRDQFALTYVQIGLLLSLPTLVSSIVEPILGILGDTRRRRAIILGGGVLFAAALLLTALSQDYGMLLASFILFYPASGAFVSISQAALMDTNPKRREHNMARWTFAGSLGVVAGPLALAGMVQTGPGWRWTFGAFAALALLLVALAWRFRFPPGHHPPGDSTAEQAHPDHGGFWEIARQALRALRRGEVLRWLALLEFSDLTMDVLLGFLALYFVDIAGLTPTQAGLAVGVWTAMGLLGDLLLIPVLERVSGLRYLRLSSVLELFLYASFLLAPEIWQKLVLIGLLGFFNAGWYAILQARLYASMPGQSGSVMAVQNIFKLVGGFLPLGLGWIATEYNLSITMWLLLAGPIALLVGIPYREGERK